MPRLINYTDLSTDSLINILKNQYIVVYEDIQGSTLYVNCTGNQISIRPRSMQNDELNKIDLAIQKYYGPVFDYFQNLSDRIKGLMPDGWWFEFEYFFDTSPAHVEYHYKPKNGLILTGIVKGKKRRFDLFEIMEYATLFDVDPLPTIFAGKLQQEQVAQLQAFIQTDPKDLEYLFKEQNFAKYFYEMLNPGSNSSVLMNDGFYQKNLEKLIIKVPKQQKEISFAIFNPMYQRNDKNDKTEFVETYSIILLNFLEYSQLVDISKLQAKGDNYADMYMDLICKLFNSWMKWNEESFNSFEFVVPTFFHDEKFKVNVDVLKNPETKKFVKKNDKIEYAFRCILGSFQNVRKKPIGILNDTSLQLMNQFILNLQKKIDVLLDLKRMSSLKNKDLMNFDQFDQTNTDSNGMPYPDIYNEVEDSKPDGTRGKKSVSVKK